MNNILNVPRAPKKRWFPLDHALALRTAVPSTVLLVLFFAVACCLAAVSAFAEPAIIEQQEFYEVKGQALREVNGEMFSGTPILINGRKHIAACYHTITWRYTFRSDADWCSIQTVSVTARITYKMPRWADYPNASTKMQSKWDTFYRQLDQHEQGHAAHAKETAASIESAIEKLKRRSCQELKDAANETGSSLLTQLKAANEEFDARTKHGVLQGAVLEF